MVKKGIIEALLCALLCAPCAVCGQNSVTLARLYEMAEEQSVSMEAFRKAVESAEKGVDIAKSQWLPDVSGELSVGYLGDGLLGDRNFSDWMHVDNPHFMNNFALKAQQVIYSGGAISASINLADMGKRMAELDYAKNRQEIRFVIASCYLDLCRLQNRQQVIDRNISLTERVIDNIKSKYSHGAALKTDITRYELQLERLKLQQTRIDAARRVTSTRLAIMLHQPESTLFEADFASVRNENTMLEKQRWNELSDGNIGLRQAGLAAEISGKKLELEKSSRRPKIAAVAELHFNGPITIEVPVINKNFGYWFAGVGISYNFSSLYKSNRRISKARTDLVQSRLQYDAAREGIDNAVQATYADYLTAYKDLETQRKSVALADENYAVVQNRYDNGLALLTDMLDASDSKLSADLDAVDAEINIIYNFFKLKYICNSL